MTSRAALARPCRNLEQHEHDDDDYESSEQNRTRRGLLGLELTTVTDGEAGIMNDRVHSFLHDRNEIPEI